MNNISISACKKHVLERLAPTSHFSSSQMMLASCRDGVKRDVKETTRRISHALVENVWVPMVGTEAPVLLNHVSSSLAQPSFNMKGCPCNLNY